MRIFFLIVFWGLGVAATAQSLADQSSPFLARHAGNAVAWRTWGPEAWEEARASGKPVLLSLGYSTCHWCHVMEDETYTNADWGARINAQFVPILVDRDERPDLDGQYQTVALALTGHTGWPLHVVLTPEGQPFAAFQYVPPETLPGLPGWDRILPGLAQLWADHRSDLAASGQELLDGLGRFSNQPPGEGSPGEDRRVAVTRWKAAFDAQNGGFDSAPKFPRFETIRALIQEGQRGDDRARVMAFRTLEALRVGGLHDRVGGGFHRYAVDAAWKEPHFEKMLIDQALAIRAFAEAWKAGAGPQALGMVRETADFLLETLLTPSGWFAVGVDAGDAETEGRFYRYSTADVVDILGPEEGPEAARVLGLPEDGSPGLVADPAGHPEGERWLKALKKERRRPLPTVDPTLLTDANGWAVGALAQAFQVTADPRYLQAAQNTVDTVLSRVRAPNGRLFHVYRPGGALVEGTLDDYAALMGGLVEVYQAGFRTSDLQAACELAQTLLADFSRPEGGFYQSRTPPGPGLSRASVWNDQPNPTGNGLALGALATLARLTGQPEWNRAAQGILRAVPTLWRQAADQTPGLINAANLLKGREIVLAGTPGRADFEALVAVVRRWSRPGDVVLVRVPGDSALEALAPFSRGYGTEGRATAYVCENFLCQLPVTGALPLANLLTQAR